ncbi:MAG: hypothetical protein QXU18_09160 [Thermoplasmatales archaeon]
MENDMSNIRGFNWKTSRILKLFLLLPVFLMLVFITLYHSFYFILYPASSVDPYIYYSYSPGFWIVDISFWLFTPLYYFLFRKKQETRIFSLIYAFCLDASAVGIFLVFFSLVYGINIFPYPISLQNYYTYAFVLSLFFLIPVQRLGLNKNLLYVIVYPIVGMLWRITGTGNIGYFLSLSVVFDLFMIFYSFLILFLVYYRKDAIS